MTNLDERMAQGRFGELVGISQQAVAALMKAGTLRRGDTAAQWLHAYCASLRAAASGRAPDDSGVSQQRSRLLAAQAHRTEVENKRRAGQLMPVAEIEAA